MTLAKFRYIAIEGNIGAGKTTLAMALAQEMEAQLVLEEFEDNPHLAGFYKDRKSHALRTERHFLNARSAQISREVSDSDKTVVADYFIDKSLLFASISLDREDFRAFEKDFRLVTNGMKKPDILFYIHTEAEISLGRIRSRGRDIEKEIKSDYLEKIHRAYLHYFSESLGYPVIILHGVTEKIHPGSEIMTKFIRLLEMDWEPGLHEFDCKSNR